MPRDLFGDVAARQPSVRVRRSPIVLATVVGHAVVLIAVALMSALAPGILPLAREALAFYEPARILDIRLPPPPTPQPARVSQPAAAVSANAAPVVAPSSIAPETGIEGVSATTTPPAVG